MRFMHIHNLNSEFTDATAWWLPLRNDLVKTTAHSIRPLWKRGTVVGCYSWADERTPVTPSNLPLLPNIYNLYCAHGLTWKNVQHQNIARGLKSLVYKVLYLAQISRAARQLSMDCRCLQSCKQDIYTTSAWWHQPASAKKFPTCRFAGIKHPIEISGKAQKTSKSRTNPGRSQNELFSCEIPLLQHGWHNTADCSGPTNCQEVPFRD